MRKGPAFVILALNELIGWSTQRRHNLLVRTARRHLAVSSPSTHVYVRTKAGRPHAVVLMLDNALPDPHQPDILYIPAEDFLKSNGKQMLDLCRKAK